MFVDASAILAILLRESDWKVHLAAFDGPRDRQPVTSVLAVWEAVVGAKRHKRLSISDAEAEVEDLLAELDIQVIPVTPHDLSRALLAFDRYGRHRYGEAERNRGLNLADCFHYACAKSRDIAILHKDAGFDLTDLPRPALPGGA